MTSDGYAGGGASGPTSRDEVLDLEIRGWEQLCLGGDATSFYRDVLDDDVVMLFPGGLVLEGAAAVLPTLGTEPWHGFVVADATVRRPTTDVAVVTYRVQAHRGGPAYEALISSLYVRRAGTWRLALHQHTPTG
jgi:hypothetical protein